MQFKNNTIMADTKMNDSQLIAPCGMDCRLCLAYQREKNHCPGCRMPDKGKMKSCISCSIKNCPKLKKIDSGFCFDCDKFPCERLKQLDKRYRGKYGMSMLANLQAIGQKGLVEFIRTQDEKWSCRKCAKLLCVHRANCLNCSTVNQGFGKYSI
jgi:hypothetical protein